MVVNVQVVTAVDQWRMLPDVIGRRPGSHGRRRLLAVLLLSGVTALAGCSVHLNGEEPSSHSPSSTSGAKSRSSKDPGSTKSSVKNSSPAPQVSGPAGSALKLLDTIAVKGRAPQTGYSRDEFGTAWKDTDHNGCDQRDDILRRDLTDETFRPNTHGCVVLSGTLVDRYTGETIAFRKSSASAVQIDHVVPLENAWVTGAYRWSKEKRTELATDPLNLLAVKGSVNESKGSGDAATWLPRKSYRCAYVARQTAVKAKYGAWMTAAEHRAIAGILATCPNEKLPVTQAIPLGNSSS